MIDSLAFRVLSTEEEKRNATYYRSMALYLFGRRAKTSKTLDSSTLSLLVDSNNNGNDTSFVSLALSVALVVTDMCTLTREDSVYL